MTPDQEFAVLMLMCLCSIMAIPLVPILLFQFIAWLIGYDASYHRFEPYIVALRPNGTREDLRGFEDVRPLLRSVKWQPRFEVRASASMVDKAIKSGLVVWKGRVAQVNTYVVVGSQEELEKLGIFIVRHVRGMYQVRATRDMMNQVKGHDVWVEKSDSYVLT
jgi:hypothetical protein